MDITRKLKDLLDRSGLSEEEIRFYINVLKKPNSTIYNLSKSAKIPKDKAYQICDSLEDRKLVTIDKNNKFKRLKATSLKNFANKLHNQGRSLHRTADSLKEINTFLPYLGATEEDHVFKTFSHEKAAEEFVDMSMLKWNEILAYGDFEAIFNAIGVDSDRQFVKNRLRRGKKCYPILSNPGDYCWKEIIEKDEIEDRQTKVIYDDKLKNCFVAFMPDINMTAIWMMNEDGLVSGAVIENSIITQLHNNIYNHFDSISEFHKFRKIEEDKISK